MSKRNAVQNGSESAGTSVRRPRAAGLNSPNKPHRKPAVSPRMAKKASRKAHLRMQDEAENQEPVCALISRSEAGMLRDLLKPAPEAAYDTSLIDQQYETRSALGNANRTGSSLSIAAGIAVTTMAGIIANLR